MKQFKEFLKEAVPTNSANAAGNPTGNPATNAGYGAHADASGPVSGFDKRLFPEPIDDLSQDYQTPAEPGLNTVSYTHLTLPTKA